MFSNAYSLSPVFVQSTTGDHTHQYCVAIKDEPTEFTSGIHAMSGAEVKFNNSELHCPDLNTILKVSPLRTMCINDDVVYRGSTSYSLPPLIPRLKK